MTKRKLWAVYDGKGDFKYAQDVEKDAHESRAVTEPSGFVPQCDVVEFVEVVKRGEGCSGPEPSGARPEPTPKPPKAED